ncbi:uncharacterized protein LOC123524665 isoform X2 [Mercenaria mercenaria]|uniref:uncharacterized protein LOC123524665 isoform X2 n=1 Tax=Mercenaria mercenaria TaxID=6596 RepID=UPI00234EFDF3|nr:uncharacterized protein LOC123524665 isoform X2 [Mercenaria mercenaria]
MEWTLETYRLDEIERRFDFPCVICVNEGFYSETDTEGFSQGDIMSIDSKMVLHKVAANFAYEEEHNGWQDPNYVQLTEKEILVPLNYKGKLKVLRDVKNFDSVRELANDFPRYAKLRENLTVTTEENVPVIIQAGTMIELDRVIPPSKLVIQFQHRGSTLVVAVPLTARGKFRTEEDKNEYTMKEAIDRYSLPQIVSFVDDEIKRVYTQDLLEGIENMRTITVKTLRLNRLLTQNVLVGHYKPLDESETNDTERFRQRTLVVLPIDNPEIRDIEVNVLKGITEDIYEEVFLVRNVSHSETGALVDGSLYVDFAMSPGIKIIPAADPKSEDSQSQDKPPPRPPKPGHLKSPGTGNAETRRKQAKKTTDGGDYVPYKPAKDKKSNSPQTHRRKQPQAVKKPAPQESDVLSDYEYPDNPSPTTHGEYLDFNLADLNFCSTGGQKNPLEKHTSKGKDLLLNLKNKFKTKDKITTPTEDVQSEIKKKVTATVKPRPPAPEPDVDVEELESNLPVYDEVNEWTMNDSSLHNYQSPPKPVPIISKAGKDRKAYPTPNPVKEKPTARVTPSSNHSEEGRKHFKDLNNEELVERLYFCDLNDFAEFCKREKLNGAFFSNVAKETLTQEMNLKGISLLKFIKMRDHNWVPT